MNKATEFFLKSQRRNYWLCQFGGWSVFVLINTFYYHALGLPEELYPHYFNSMYFVAFTGLVVTHIMRSVIIGLNVLGLPFKKQIIWFIIITISFSLINTSITVSVDEAMSWEPMYYRTFSFSEKWLKDSLGTILYFTIWNLLYFVYHYISSLQKKLLNEAQLETLVKELELKTIKAHINPHFIFNALNSIRALVDENPQNARTAITNLSQLLRISLKAEKQNEVSLEEEMNMVKNYLALEQIRFEDRLKVNIDIDPQALQQKVPHMMVQTLVENAIKHGISKQTKGGEIWIWSELTPKHHQITIRNTGQLNGFRNKDGFGLQSTQERLQLLYQNRANFEIQQAGDNLVEAKINIPIK